MKTSYTAEDLARGIAALTEKANWWSFGGYRDQITTAAFRSVLTPLEFQQQLRHSFGIKV